MISIAEFKSHARIVDDPADAGAVQNAIDSDIQLKLDTAEQQAEILTGRTFTARTLAMKFDRWASSLDLDHPPVQTIESVVYFDEQSANQTLPGSNYYLHEGALFFTSLFTSPALADRPGAITVTYTAGYAAEKIPAPVKAWVLMRAAALFETRESDNDRATDEVSFVDSLLDPYRLVRV